VTYLNQETSSFLDILGSPFDFTAGPANARITETSKTLIDNIFTSVTEFDCISGNLLHSISDRLPQFLLMSSIDKYSGNGAYQNWSKFDQENLLREFSEISWHETLKIDDG